MASTDIKLRILLEAVGLKPTTKQLKDLSKTLQKAAGKSETLSASSTKTAKRMKQVGKEANKTKRNLEGVAQRAGSTAKDFSRMQQGMGGLVQAYATIAANVFALSSAFLVLRKTADLSSMIKSAEDFSNRFGVSVVRITKRMQEASGGALSFADALPTINKAISAGIGISQMEELTVAATKAAQTFGGSTTEALNRFISAAQRGRVEIIQTLGVVIKTEQAYKDYAASIGKTALELTAIDRQQAILNATVKASQEVFAGVNIDPNPFQQFLTTMIDLKDTIGTAITDYLTPFINLLNKSIPVAAAVMALVLKSVAAKAFPLFTGALERVTKAGIASSRAVTNAQVVARQKRVKNILEETQQVRGLTTKQLRSRLELYENYHGRVLRGADVFHGKLFDKQGRANKQNLLQLKNYLGQATRQRTKFGTIRKGSEQQSGQTLINAQNLVTAYLAESGALKTVNTQQANYNNAMAVSTNRVIEFGRAVAVQFGKAKVVIKSFTSSTISGFAFTFGKAQQGLLGLKLALTSTTRAWWIFVRDIVTGGATVSKVFLNLGKVAGRTVGLLSGIFAKVIGPLFTFGIYLSLAKVAWDALQDRFNSGAKEIKIIKEALTSFNETLDSITANTENYISNLRGAIDTNTQFRKNLEFLRGTIDSTIVAFKDLDLQFSNIFEGRGVSQTLVNIGTLNKNITSISASIEKLENSTTLARVANQQIRLPEESQAKVDNVRASIRELESETQNLNNTLALTDEALGTLVLSSGEELSKNFVSLNNLFKSEGITNFENKTVKAFRDMGKAGDGFIQALDVGSSGLFFKALSELKGEDIAKAFNIMNGSITEFGESLLNAVKAQIGASNSLDDLNNRIGNYTSGIDKLKSASVPNKESFNFILDAKRALETLQSTAKVTGNLGKLTEDIISGKDLQTLKEFFNIDPNSSLEAALGQVNHQFNIYKAVIDDTINATGELKIITLELSTLKLQEVKSDRDRISLIKEETKLLVRKSELELRIAKNSFRSTAQSLANLISTGQGQSDAANTLRSSLSVLEATIRARKTELDAVKNSKKELKEYLNISKDIINNAKSQTSAQLKLENINSKLSESVDGYLEAQRKIYNLNLKSIANAAALQRIKIADVILNEQEGELKRRNLELAYLELAALEAQTRELEKQQRSRRSTDLENAGKTPIFSKAGAQEAARWFIDEIIEEGKKLKSTFEILGRGFVKVLKDGISSAIDTAISGIWGPGGRTFGRAVLETLKAGLRDVIGEALKARILDAFSGFFEQFKTQKQKDNDPIEIAKSQLAVQRRIADNTEKFGKVLPTPQLKIVETMGLQTFGIEKEFDSLEALLASQGVKQLAETIKAKDSSEVLLEELISKPEDTTQLEVANTQLKIVNEQLKQITINTEPTDTLPAPTPELEVVKSLPDMSGTEAGLKSIEQTLNSNFSDLITKNGEANNKSTTLLEELIAKPADGSVTELKAANTQLKQITINTKPVSPPAEVKTPQLKIVETLDFPDMSGTEAKLTSIEQMLGLNLQDLITKTSETKDSSKVLLEELIAKPEDTTELKTANTQLKQIANNTKVASTSAGAVPPQLDIVKTLDFPDMTGTESGLKSVEQVLSSNLPDLIEKTSEGTEATRSGFFDTIKTLFQVISAIISAGASQAGGFLASLFGFGATGGMLPGRAPIAQFAGGAITRGPQLAVIGEGPTNEAVVPLPNNREIPVDLKQSAGDTINIEQNFDFSNASASAIPQLRAEARAIEDRTFNRVFSEINKGGRYAKVVGRR